MACIMIIDDNPTLVDLFTIILEKGGHSTIAAKSGLEACELINNNKPDLIMLDIMMEPIDGWETMKRIRDVMPSADVPIVMLTAKQLTTEEILNYSRMIDGYVMKPVTATQLREIVESIIDSRKDLYRTVEKARGMGVADDVLQGYIKLKKDVFVAGRMLGLLKDCLEGDFECSIDALSFGEDIVRIESEIEENSKKLKEIEANLLL